MSEDFENSLFFTLPNEVLIKILGYINTSTVLNFCEVYNCDYFLKERNVIRTIDICRKYDLYDLGPISKKINFNHVSTLNVNCLYWIQAAKLRYFISKMVNLETLYAMQTNFSLSAKDTEVLCKSKIRKLGVNVNKHDELGAHKIPSIEALYISVPTVKTLASPMTIELIFPNLNKLWIDVEEPCGREIILHCLNAATKSKIFCQVGAPVPSINFEHYWLTTYYSNRRLCQPYVMCCEKLSTKQLRSKSIFELEGSLDSWRVLDELHCSRPYGPKDARKLFLNETTLDDIFFEELNFHHTGPICNQRCRESVKEILKSSCAQKLKRLCIMMCLLENKNIVKSQDSSFIKKRIGLETSTSSHPAEKMFANISGLEHLEIYACHSTSHQNAIQGYPLISMFANLQTLVIEVPISVDGNFLGVVLQKCQLKVLKIFSIAQNETLNTNICHNIAKATSLVDFRFENHRIPLDRLLENLCLIKTRNLQRIAFFCKEIDKFSSAPFKEFLEINKQLVFLYFLIKNCTEASLRLAQQHLHFYKKKHPCKVFLVKKGDSFTNYPIPEAHYEMISYNNNVASLSPLDDFLTF